MNNFEQDMTFCENKECANMDCRRHHSHIDWSVLPKWRSFAMFEGSAECPLTCYAVELQETSISRKYYREGIKDFAKMARNVISLNATMITEEDINFMERELLNDN